MAQPNRCTDYPTSHSIPRDAHDLYVTNQCVLLDLAECAVYELHYECKSDNCPVDDLQPTLEPIGQLPRTDTEIRDTAYEIYETSFKKEEEIDWYIFKELVPFDDPSRKQGITNDYANASRYGCIDGVDGNPKRTKEELAELLF